MHATSALGWGCQGMDKSVFLTLLCIQVECQFRCLSTSRLLILYSCEKIHVFSVHAYCRHCRHKHTLKQIICLQRATPSYWWRHCGAETAAVTISPALRSGLCHWPLAPAPEPDAPGLSDLLSYCTHKTHRYIKPFIILRTWNTWYCTVGFTWLLPDCTHVWHSQGWDQVKVWNLKGEKSHSKCRWEIMLKMNLKTIC